MREAIKGGNQGRQSREAIKGGNQGIQDEGGNHVNQARSGAIRITLRCNHHSETSSHRLADQPLE